MFRTTLKNTAGLSGIETSRLLKATYILYQPIHGSICDEKKKKKGNVFMPWSASDFLWSGELDCTTLYGIYSKMLSGGVEKLLNMILDPASRCCCWMWLPTQTLQRRTEENTDVMHINIE